jgi:hypothetical protein
MRLHEKFTRSKFNRKEGKGIFATGINLPMGMDGIKMENINH